MPSLLSAARAQLLPPAGRLVVGFSGGADSTALAHWLMGQAEPGRILLAHVNHGLRGEEAYRDQAFAQNFAARWGLNIRVLEADVAALAKKRGQGLEDCGRQVRYQFFHQLAPGREDRILTAHNAEDNAETLLLNLCRGAALEGLCGIPEVRGKILRPLLGVSREEIEAYCTQNSLDFVTDSSNLTDSYARNRLRHQVAPVLKALNPRFVQAAGQTAELLSADREYLRGEARRLLEKAKTSGGLEAAPLREAPGPLSSRALKLFLEEKGCGRLEKKHLDQALAVLARGGGMDLPGGLWLRCAQGMLFVGKNEDPGGFCFPAKLGENPLPGGKILVLSKKTRSETENQQKIKNLLFKNALDYDLMTGTLVLRSRRPGDRFAPAGRGVSKPLKQIFQENRAPAARRASLPLLECGGRLAWCPGAGVAEGFQVTEKTRVVLVVEWTEGQGEGIE